MELTKDYLIVTPCRDEAEFIRKTIDSVAAQTIPPKLWIIVDDGSADETPAILEEAKAAHPFIQTVRLERNRERSVGPGVMQAFYAGLDTVDVNDFDYICKLDGDLELGPRYFERIMELLDEDPWLGTISGKTYLRQDGQEFQEHIGDENAVGAAKFYRTECFQEIGGFVRQLGWDGLDGHMCRQHGWKAVSLDESELRIIHLRRIGSSHISFWHGRKRWGKYKHFIGSSWYYVMAASLFRMRERPYLLSGLGILAGYYGAALRKESKFPDISCRDEVRRFERECLMRGKTRTLADYHARIEQAHPERATRPHWGAQVHGDEPAKSGTRSDRFHETV